MIKNSGGSRGRCTAAADPAAETEDTDMLRKMVEFACKMALMAVVFGMFAAAGNWAVGAISLLELAAWLGVLGLAASRLSQLITAPARPRRRAASHTPARRPRPAVASAVAVQHRRAA